MALKRFERSRLFPVGEVPYGAGASQFADDWLAFRNAFVALVSASGTIVDLDEGLIHDAWNFNQYRVKFFAVVVTP